MRVMLENFNEKHISLLKEMAGVLKFKIKNLDSTPAGKATPAVDISVQEERDMTLLSMQASQQSMAELWDKEEDEYWNSYL